MHHKYPLSLSSYPKTVSKSVSKRSAVSTKQNCKDKRIIQRQANMWANVTKIAAEVVGVFI